MNEQELKNEIASIKSQIDNVKNDLQILNDSLGVKNIELYKLQTGFNIEDIIEWKDGREIKSGVIESFNFDGYDTFPVVKVFKSDGKTGNRRKTIYSFYEPKKVS